MARPTDTYWSHSGTHEELSAKLALLIPEEGSVSNARSRNKALEKFRKACNCYYDLYNNGLCNRAAEFRRVFGISCDYYRFSNRREYFPHLYVETETAMDKIVLAAAVEQGIVSAGIHVVV